MPIKNDFVQVPPNVERDNQRTDSSTGLTTITDGENSISNSALAREEETKKGMDGAQITGGASSYARKYALSGLLLLENEKDSDSTNHHNKTQKQTQTQTQTQKVQVLVQALGRVLVRGWVSEQEVRWPIKRFEVSLILVK